MKLNKTTGANIRKLREALNLKQQTLANELKVSVQTLSYIENGKQDIKLSQLEKIATALNVSIHALLMNEEKTPRVQQTLGEFSDEFFSKLETFIKRNEAFELLEINRAILWQIKKVNTLLKTSAGAMISTSDKY